MVSGDRSDLDFVTRMGADQDRIIIVDLVATEGWRENWNSPRHGVHQNWRVVLRRGVSSEALFFFAKNTSYTMRKRMSFLTKRRFIMSISTLAAGLVIIAGAALLKLVEKEDKEKKEEFENSY